MDNPEKKAIFKPKAKDKNSLDVSAPDFDLIPYFKLILSQSKLDIELNARPPHSKTDVRLRLGQWHHKGMLEAISFLGNCSDQAKKIIRLAINLRPLVRKICGGVNNKEKVPPAL